MKSGSMRFQKVGRQSWQRNDTRDLSVYWYDVGVLVQSLNRMSYGGKHFNLSLNWICIPNFSEIRYSVSELDQIFTIVLKLFWSLLNFVFVIVLMELWHQNIAYGILITEIMKILAKTQLLNILLLATKSLLLITNSHKNLFDAWNLCILLPVFYWFYLFFYNV